MSDVSNRKDGGNMRRGRSGRMSMWKKHTRTQRCPLLVWLDSRLMCSSMTLRRESRISVCVSLYSELLLIARLDRHAAVRRIIIFRIKTWDEMGFSTVLRCHHTSPNSFPKCLASQMAFAKWFHVP